MSVLQPIEVWHQISCNYNLKTDNYLTIWEFECLALQHYIISIFDSRILKILFLDLSFIRLSETYSISILEKAYLDGA